MAAFILSGKIGAYGDGGAITTNNAKLQKFSEFYAISARRKIRPRHAWNQHRLDTIQAAVLSVKLKHLDAWNKKTKIASYYISNLGDLGDLIMPTNDNNTNWHLFVIQTKKRDGLMHYLEKRYPYRHPLPRPSPHSCFKIFRLQKGDFCCRTSC